MPLFDFFKKSPKKESSKPSSSDNPFASPELQKKRYEAAMEFVELFRERTPLLNGKPHAGTVMSAAARLAGTSLFRAINKREVKPGVVVLSEEVNTAYPQLLNLFAYYCKQNGIDVMEKPLVTSFPEGDSPLMELHQILEIYQDEYNKIMEKHELDYLEGARAGMIVCSVFFDDLCIKNKAIDPYVATGIVAMGVVEGAKTSPVLLNSKEQAKSTKQDKKLAEVEDLLKTVAKSSISGSGNRLFFGERNAAMREALKHNGKYILVHPDVENKLKQGNIDPYGVYAMALINEMQARIDQLDFIGGDVDQLEQQWSGKPKSSIPVHIRQMLLMKENAEKFGYKQSGNSWKLKS